MMYSSVAYKVYTASTTETHLYPFIQIHFVGRFGTYAGLPIVLRQHVKARVKLALCTNIIYHLWQHTTSRKHFST